MTKNRCLFHVAVPFWLTIRTSVKSGLNGVKYVLMDLWNPARLPQTRTILRQNICPLQFKNSLWNLARMANTTSNKNHSETSHNMCPVQVKFIFWMDSEIQPKISAQILKQDLFWDTTHHPFISRHNTLLSASEIKPGYSKCHYSDVKIFSRTSALKKTAANPPLNKDRLIENYTYFTTWNTVLVFV